ncbi:hypothetical protein I204_04011 [Kwoniella mangroviensis CBS 8886]|uniref:uncharacterized protein n=1 Tax=Kwoniella mangroviensis CBS 8507 TaxID=1296122 RepID=UPI00080CE430|nr:uncharacterized protein I203_05571 [Kwoniella mangroviensis CBS 8507]OCF65324.1 hypothetical protein I203_05571 [Kwoniella mangroviensis CBS 8507]OCF75161.1 hypothetical protein I204_04011 [Kwoniella mangroviensis CBS 8886]
MTSFLSLPSSSSSSSNKLDSQALATLIRQLKRSPESPSRLTLPPIMGVIQEEDEDHEGTSVVVEEVDSGSSSNGTSPDTPSDRSGLYDIPEEDEHEETDGALWVIDEESDENIPPSENQNLNQDNPPPMDPHSPPPPSPCMTHIPSPTLPDNPIVPNSYYPEDENDTPSTYQKVPSPLAELSSEQFSDAESEQEESVVTPYYESNTSMRLIPQQRRRRKTLGELEQYRKFAMNKAAWKSYQEAEALEEQRRIREREEREGLWMRYSFGAGSNGRSRDRWNRPDLITRAQSFPPTILRTNTEPIYATLYSDPDPGRDEQLTSNWYIDDVEGEDAGQDGNQVQVQHVEYVSSPRSMTEGVDDEEDVLSPVSEHIQTPALPNDLDNDNDDDEPRRFFPNATQIFGSSFSSFPSNGQSYGQSDREYEYTAESNITVSAPTYGLGLGLSGMTSDQQRGAKINTRMSFDQMIKYEEGKQHLEEDEISLVELPIRMIFPERTFEEFKAAGREYTRKLKEHQSNEKDMGSHAYDELCEGERDDSHDRSTYREDLDGLPIPERGRSRSRIKREIDMESTESYLSDTSTANSSGSSPNDQDDYDSNYPYYFTNDEKEKAKGLVYSDEPEASEAPDRSNSTSPDSQYSTANEQEEEGDIELNLDRRLTISPELQDGDDEEFRVVIDSRRRHSAPGKLPSYLPGHFPEFDESGPLNMGDGFERLRSKSECSIHI